MPDNRIIGWLTPAPRDWHILMWEILDPPLQVESVLFEVNFRDPEQKWSETDLDDTGDDSILLYCCFLLELGEQHFTFTPITTCCALV